MRGKIAEIFDSVQGEGIYLGEKQLFVRFFGCNLNCKFCDTKLKWFKEYEPEELFCQVKKDWDDFHSISFTGGEPLMQKDFLKEVLKLTNRENYKSYLETNGTLPDELEEVIDFLDIVSMDLKLPTSTELDSFWDKHARFLKIASKKEVFLKAVICNSTSEEDLRNSIRLIKHLNRAMVLILQPNSLENQQDLTKKSEYFQEICSGENITSCVIPQIHKKIGLI